ncbi:exodeoxyribonuclease V subunit beta [Undibacterium sp.]|uniref:UvrD-helicase domain-containing protein n=1 Tax=Undibacterium sp. TaxID=1914977 RepID=UPI002730B442|nr:UvrD-helicase domain-containing protein [Undibacterium sp.]MDP1977534.1 UvrD-helicase domain-containing protein [Undibacterium sp.]
MTEPLQYSHSYEVNGEAVSHAHFTATACDPRHSVVVEACAGSGKTWLLVSRMLRLLLAGAEPAELLAITFTRKAAQEMRERLMDLLHELALADIAHVRQLLTERGIVEADLQSVIPLARGLYEKVLSSPQSLSLDTFHSWFGRLIQLAPLASGVPHGFTLVEASGDIQREAYGQLMQMLVQEEHADIKEALLFLYQEIGDFNAREMLEAFLDKRAEWWASNQQIELGGPLDWLRDLCGADLYQDARLSIWEDAQLYQRIAHMALVLGQGSKNNQTNASKIEQGLTDGPSLEAFAMICDGFINGQGNIRSHNVKVKALITSIEKHLGLDQINAFEDECEAIVQALNQLQKRSAEKMVMQVNEALFAVGTAYLKCYQSLKSDQRVFDFADLEWQAYRLLSNEEYAAYLHSRLDARYKHILLDEFQDTNPLQWGIVQAWLEAYGDDGAKPSVFVVGDPKQSIYRFRRAEPRVFTAAQNMLAGQGARVLRTNQTRRNAPAIVDVLNVSMHGNPLFHAQTTASDADGAVWRLPLIGAVVSDEVVEEEVAPTRFPLRNSLTTPLEEAENQQRYEEGKQVAQALLGIRAVQGAASFHWSDVMLLVKRRTHLSAYEKALREAGIPFVSSRRGGLLDALEVLDLIALLNFLMTPGDNRALAHVLKSPIMAASDDDLIDLALRDEATWWKRLQALALQQDESSPVLQRAARLLQQWMEASYYLPVHDLLDRILHQGEVLQRYAQASSVAQRSQVTGNIHSFTELALNLDAGRYPSLPKFIAALSALRRGGDSDAPDESAVDSAADAVRILTIHSAKGLEAKIVVMLDANHSESMKDRIGVLCQWPLQAGEERHFSVFGKKDQRGAARDRFFAQEEAQATQENWNLLYVAITRAKQVLIVSGVQNGKKQPAPSWYAYLDRVGEKLPVAVNVENEVQQHQSFSMAVFEPLAMPAEELILEVSSDEQLEGIALHTLMERLSNNAKTWPIAVPDAETIAAWLPCSSTVAAAIRKQAECIFSNSALQKFYDPAVYVYARNEMDVLVEQKLLRLDRVVVFSHEVWVLDYKRQLLPGQDAGYRQQLLGYVDALNQVFSDKTVHAALILSDSSLIDLL